MVIKVCFLWYLLHLSYTCTLDNSLKNSAIHITCSLKNIILDILYDIISQNMSKTCIIWSIYWSPVSFLLFFQMWSNFDYNLISFTACLQARYCGYQTLLLGYICAWGKHGWNQRPIYNVAWRSDILLCCNFLSITWLHCTIYNPLWSWPIIRELCLVSWISIASDTRDIHVLLKVNV